MALENGWHLAGVLDAKSGRRDPFAAAIRSTRIAMIVTDPKLRDNPIIFANAAFLSLTGYDDTEVRGRNCRFLQGPATCQETIGRVRQAIHDQKDIAVDILNYRKNGEELWISLYISPVFNEHGELDYFFGSQLDISERVRREAETRRAEADRHHRTIELERANETQRLLIREIDHRAKNNLQMISATLLLQVMSITDPKVQVTLQSMVDRVQALGLVHKQFYETNSVSHFEVGGFTREIAHLLAGLSGRKDIAIDLDVGHVEVPADRAAPLALIINEGLTNALKHGCASMRNGRLTVRVTSQAGMCDIWIQDNGPGFIPARDGDATFGINLIRTLAKQLKGTVEWQAAGPGTILHLSFRNAPAAEISATTSLAS